MCFIIVAVQQASHLAPSCSSTQCSAMLVLSASGQAVAVVSWLVSPQHGVWALPSEGHSVAACAGAAEPLPQGVLLRLLNTEGSVVIALLLRAQEVLGRCQEELAAEEPSEGGDRQLAARLRTGLASLLRAAAAGPRVPGAKARRTPAHVRVLVLAFGHCVWGASTPAVMLCCRACISCGGLARCRGGSGELPEAGCHVPLHYAGVWC